MDEKNIPKLRDFIRDLLCESAFNEWCRRMRELQDKVLDPTEQDSLIDTLDTVHQARDRYRELSNDPVKF